MDDNLKYYSTFFGEGEHYYAERMYRFLKGRYLSFNFFAFLKGPFWLLYRKLWVPAIIVFSIYFMLPLFVVVLAVIFNFSQISTLLISIFLFAVAAIVMGFIGNAIYFNYAKRKVQYIVESFDDEPTRLQKLKAFGGTSILMHILFVLYVLLVVLLPQIS